jgi:hypothetical protein
LTGMVQMPSGSSLRSSTLLRAVRLSSDRLQRKIRVQMLRWQQPPLPSNPESLWAILLVTSQGGLDMRWEEPCPIPEGIHEFIGLLDVALQDPAGLIGLFAALLDGKPYLDMQLPRNDFRRIERILERARKAGLEKLNYEVMGESLLELRDLLRTSRPAAKHISHEVADEYWKSHRPQPPRHLPADSAFSPRLPARRTRKTRADSSRK